MFVLTRAVVVVALCLITNGAQSPEPSKLIREINADKVKALNTTEEADRKQKEGRAKVKAGDRSEGNKLFREAAKLYGEISKINDGMANKADEVAKVRDPEWYSEYFTTWAKYFRLMAEMAAGAEKQTRTDSEGGPTKSQVESWKADVKRLRKEIDELWKKIEEIEIRRGVVLIK